MPDFREAGDATVLAKNCDGRVTISFALARFFSDYAIGVLAKCIVERGSVAKPMQMFFSKHKLLLHAKSSGTAQLSIARIATGFPVPVMASRLRHYFLPM